jgi:hypothetical protein
LRGRDGAFATDHCWPYAQWLDRSGAGRECTHAWNSIHVHFHIELAASVSAGGPHLIVGDESLGQHGGCQDAPACGHHLFERARRRPQSWPAARPSRVSTALCCTTVTEANVLTARLPDALRLRLHRCLVKMLGQECGDSYYTVVTY